MSGGRGAGFRRLARRAYGGFTSQQEAFYLRNIGSITDRSIVDPMSGQGHALAALAWQGAHVWLSDINSAPLALAMLRNPSFVTRYEQMTDHTRRLLQTVPPRRRRGAQYCEEWLPPDTVDWLTRYAYTHGVAPSSWPLAADAPIWKLNLPLQFSLLLPVLAARDLACYRATDNLTWLKPGSYDRHRNPKEAVLQALHQWGLYAKQVIATCPSREVDGSLIVRQSDPCASALPSPLADAIITSPPYANRLDYARMWGPEVAVITAMLGGCPDSLRRLQLGTTVVRHLSSLRSATRSLPAATLETLERIRLDPSPYSDSYYYPFFCNYAIMLQRALRHSHRRLRRRGVMCIFVRDTVRKDVLFETGKLVRALLEASGLQQVDCERQVVKAHIGNVRRGGASGVYGLAQQEWLLAYRKGA